MSLKNRIKGALVRTKVDFDNFAEANIWGATNGENCKVWYASTDIWRDSKTIYSLVATQNDDLDSVEKSLDEEIQVAEEVNGEKMAYKRTSNAIFCEYEVSSKGSLESVKAVYFTTETAKKIPQLEMILKGEEA
jgi:hypothetical protein